MKDIKIENIKNDIKQVMDASLYEHSLQTMATAEGLLLKNIGKIRPKDSSLARKKVQLASLLHDYAKTVSYEEMVRQASKNGWEIDDFILGCRPILHGFAGYYMVRRDFGIQDGQVLDAIRYHSTGKKNMSIIEKIIYISDKIEQTREYEDIGLLRELSEKDLDACLLEVYKKNMIYVLNKNQALYPDTCGIWNNILEVYI